MGVVLVPRPTSARREEGAYRHYSTDEERRLTGWIGGQKREVILDRALSGPVREYGGIRPAMPRPGTILRTTATGHYNGMFGLVAGHEPRAGRLAQLVEHRLYTPAVTGSSPVPPTTHDSVYDAGS